MRPHASCSSAVCVGLTGIFVDTIAIYIEHIFHHVIYQIDGHNIYFLVIGSLLSSNYYLVMKMTGQYVAQVGLARSLIGQCGYHVACIEQSEACFSFVAQVACVASQVHLIGQCGYLVACIVQSDATCSTQKPT